MKKIRVDFNNYPLRTSERQSGSLEVGERVFVYTLDDTPPFGHPAWVYEAKDGIYHLELLADSDWVEFKDLSEVKL